MTLPTACAATSPRLQCEHPAQQHTMPVASSLTRQLANASLMLQAEGPCSCICRQASPAPQVLAALLHVHHEAVHHCSTPDRPGQLCLPRVLLMLQQAVARCATTLGVCHVRRAGFQPPRPGVPPVTSQLPFAVFKCRMINQRDQCTQRQCRTQALLQRHWCWRLRPEANLSGWWVLTAASRVLSSMRINLMTGTQVPQHS